MSSVILAITGASGAIYSVRLLQVLMAAGRDVHLSISDSGKAVLKQELDLDVDLTEFNAAQLVRPANPQGDHAKLLREVLRLSPTGRLRHLVQLHLSRDCNRPLLAAQSAGAVLAREGLQVAVHTAAQDRPCRPITLGGPESSPPLPRPRSLGPRRPRAAPPVRPWLPGWEE